MSWHLGQIGRGAALVASAPMTVAYGPADHAYEVAASAEGPVGRGGRSRPIASFGLFHAITVTRKGLTLHISSHADRRVLDMAHGRCGRMVHAQISDLGVGDSKSVFSANVTFFSIIDFSNVPLK